MSKKPTFINANRRSFIQKSAVVGGAAATGAVTTTAVAGETVSTEESKPVHAGYQLTDRVREYYRKARF